MARVAGGLGGAWREVKEAIEALGSSYSRVNRIISLGLDIVIRRIGVRLSGANGRRILDAGAGDGSLSAIILEEFPDKGLFMVLLDPSLKMLRLARRRIVWSRVDAVVGLLEYAPFRPSSFGSAFMAFALRDVLNLSSASEMLARVLRPRGIFTIIDIAKPDSALTRQLLGLYWRILAPFLVASTLSRGWREIGLIHKTFLLLLTESDLIWRLSRHFSLERKKRLLLGAAHILVFRRLEAPSNRREGG